MTRSCAHAAAKACFPSWTRTAHGLRNEIPNEHSEKAGNFATACSPDSFSKWNFCREAIWYTLLKQPSIGKGRSMNGNKFFQISLAVIADIYGNRWALEAVLQDIDRRGIQQIVNLGDHLTGPLDPAGTADLLIEHGMLSVCGNDDRVLFSPRQELTSSQRYT